MPDFSIRVANDELLFSASHFITFEGGDCEPLHGHDYHVSAEVRGPLNASQYVIDFTVLRETLKNILKQLDHRVLIAQKHPRINIQTIGNDLEVKLGGRRWVLPKEDCILLPMTNTTSEMLAQYLALRIAEDLSALKINPPKHIKVEVREGNGFSAIYQLDGNE
jgi:6-pyruvoyltetrahydropterin/6-carboxytetrahydropterin synthase